MPSGITPLHFCEKGGKIDAHIYQEVVLKGVVEPHNTTYSVVRNVSSSRTQLLPARPRSQIVAAEEYSSVYQRLIISSQGVQTSTPWTINLSCFGGCGLLKASQQTGEPEEIPDESISRFPPGEGACHDSRGTGGSEGLHWGRGHPFCVSIINKT